MSGQVVLYRGVFTVDETREHPYIVTTEDGREWLASVCNNEELFKHLKQGQEVLIYNRESEFGHPTEEQEKYDARTDNYCNICCPFCGRSHL